MNLDKLSPAEGIIASCGVALLVFSFLPWFGYGGAHHNAWATAFSALGVLVGVLMVTQIALARLTTASLPKLPISWGDVHMVLGVLALALIVAQYLVGDRVTPAPIADIPATTIDFDPQYGIVLGTFAAAGLAYGAFRRRKEPDNRPDPTP